MSLNKEAFYDSCREILTQLMYMENSTYFFKPVDPERDYAPDYFQYTTKPMSFFDIQQKLDKKIYVTPNEFIQDVRQIWENAKNYNQPSHSIHVAACKLSARFEILIGSLPYVIEEQDKSSALQRYIELRFSRYRANKKAHL